MPAPTPTQQRADRRAIDRCQAKARTAPSAAASMIDRPNQRRRDSAPTMRRAGHDADAETEEEHGEEDVERGVAAAERLGVELRGADDHAAAGERAEDAEHQAADQRGPADVRPALDELPEQPGLALAGGRAPAADLLDAEEHDERGGEEGQRVEVQRESVGVEPGCAGRRRGSLDEPAGRGRRAPGRPAIGVRPYVVARVSWLAVSSRARGSRLGTAASLAGVQTIVVGLDDERGDGGPADDEPRCRRRAARRPGSRRRSTNRIRSQTTIV